MIVFLQKIHETKPILLRLSGEGKKTSISSRLYKQAKITPNISIYLYIYICMEIYM